MHALWPRNSAYYANLTLQHFKQYLKSESFTLFVSYNRPENNSEVTNHYQTCAKTIRNTLNPWFYHIKYDETYMPELFLTPGAPTYAKRSIVDDLIVVL